MTRFCFAILLAGLLTSLGCEASSPPPTSPPSTGTVPAGPTPAEIAAATTAMKTAPAVTLDIKNWDETLALVAEHKGKVVVLDLWSTSCEPCMVEFPHLVELHKRHGGKLVCMSASCDYAGIKNKPPESYRDHVLEFLTQKNATFQNVLLNVESDALFEKIELASIPAVYVFGTDGNIAKRFDNDHAKSGEDFTYVKDIVPFLEKLLSE
jgi:thiol-disulfide isomerase/thioredoxin